MTMGYPQAATTAGEILREIDSTSERLRFLLRIASYINRTTVAQRLSQAIAAATLELKVAFFGKPGLGAARLARAFEQSAPAGCRLITTVLESPLYSDLDPAALAGVRESSVAVFLVPAAAPFFDETLDFMAAGIPGGGCKRVIVVDSDDAALAGELTHTVAGDQRLRDVAVTTEAQFVPLLTDACLCAAAQSRLTELRALASGAARELRPAASAFANFLALPQPGYLRRIDYIQRDLDALSDISRRSHEFLSRQMEEALSRAATAARAIVPAMRQQAETIIQQSVPPTATDLRGRFGQQTSAAARAAGYREFDERVRSLAMLLNSARSILLTTMEQFRAEAQPHIEELIANLGQDIYLVWMREAGFDWGARPLELSLDPGVDFPDLILAAAARVAQSVPEQSFVTGWQNRLDAVLRSDMITAATSGWTTMAVDQPLVSAVGTAWNEAAQRACGLLIGRLDALVHVVGTGVASTRLGSLRLPADPGLRRQTASLYRGFADAISSEIPA
jgi:hypothetical protein